MVVEDGTGKTNSDSYASVDFALTYCLLRGITAWSAAAQADCEAALIRATDWIDATYRAAFPGYRRFGTMQSLEWPRMGAFKTSPDGEVTYPVAQDYVPREVMRATVEAAIRELAEPGSMQPDLTRDAYVRSVSAGSVSVTFAGIAPTQTVVQTVDAALSGLLIDVGTDYSGSVVRA